MQLQIAPNPQDIIAWMFEHGVYKTVRSYNLNVEKIQEISTQGTLAISKWTAKLNKIISSQKFPIKLINLSCMYETADNVQHETAGNTVIFCFNKSAMVTENRRFHK